MLYSACVVRACRGATYWALILVLYPKRRSVKVHVLHIRSHEGLSFFLIFSWAGECRCFQFRLNPKFKNRIVWEEENTFSLGSPGFLCSPTLLPVYMFTFFMFCLFSYYILFRTRQYKQAGFTTVSIWRTDRFGFVFLYSLLYHTYSLLYHTYYMVRYSCCYPFTSYYVYGLMLFTYPM